MEKNSLGKSSFILTLSKLAASILGFIFSIYLSKHLGPEGMGLYGLVKPIHMLFTSIVCGGIVTAVSKLSSEYYGRNDYKNLKRTLKTSMTFIFLWAIFISTLLFLFSSILGSYVIKDTRIITSLQLLCPAIVFIALSNCLKGYFYGTFHINMPAFIDILEKAIRIFIFVLIINNLKATNVSTTVTVAYFTLCLGEIISFLFLYAYYKLSLKKASPSTNKGESRAQLLFNILSISLPLLVSRFISSLLSTFSTLIIPSRLVSSGLEYKAALGLIGKFNGMARNIVFFPMVVIESISVLLIPNISANLAKKHYKSVEYHIRKALEVSYILGAATFIISLSIGDNLGFMLYTRNDLGNYIKFMALAAPVFYTDATSYGILNGLGKQKIILRNSTILSILRIILLYILVAIPSINIYGYGLASMIISLISLSINIYEIKKNTLLKFSLPCFIIDNLIVVFTYFILIILTKALPQGMFIFNNVMILLCGFSMIFFLRNILKNWMI